MGGVKVKYESHEFKPEVCMTEHMCSKCKLDGLDEEDAPCKVCCQLGRCHFVPKEEKS